MSKYGNRIARVLAIDRDSYTLRLRFSDGFVGTLRLGAIFEEPRALAAEVCRGELFARCFVESGALAWPNGLAFCPDAVRRWIHRQVKTPGRVSPRRTPLLRRPKGHP